MKSGSTDYNTGLHSTRQALRDEPPRPVRSSLLFVVVPRWCPGAWGAERMMGQRTKTEEAHAPAHVCVRVGSSSSGAPAAGPVFASPGPARNAGGGGCCQEHSRAGGAQQELLAAVGLARAPRAAPPPRLSAGCAGWSTVAIRAVTTAGLAARSGHPAPSAPLALFNRTISLSLCPSRPLSPPYLPAGGLQSHGTWIRGRRRAMAWPQASRAACTSCWCFVLGMCTRATPRRGPAAWNQSFLGCCFSFMLG